MPHYLIQVGYSSGALAALLKKQEKRVDAVRPVIEKLGGKVDSAYLSFGDYDAVLIVEMPDSVSAAAIAMAFGAGGGCKTVKTTPLLTSDEGVEAMKKAAKSGYKPPAG